MNRTSHCGNDLPAQLRARRDAAQRMPPLPCGCRDPWPCRCTQPTMTEHQAQSAAAAAQHLLGHGLPPVFEVDTLRAMWRYGDRELAQQLYDLAGGEAA